VLGQEFPYSELAHAPDERVEWFLRNVMGLEPTDCRFQLVEVPLVDMESNITPDPEEYLADFDGEVERRRVLSMVRAYERGGPEELPPIVSQWDEQASVPGWSVIDGSKRLTAAYVAGVEALRVYKLLG
jgi:hypothetical protein